jgi:BirA family transcriptional regulator, biotin operon repressor / biotin---[acetyl-CoA-carboxylase] ligase
MNTPPVRWPAEAIWEAICPQLPGFTVEVLPQVDSTNSELMRRARAGQCEPILLVAKTQTAGRGQRGRAWHSPAGASLTFSLGLPLAPVAWGGFSLAVGLAVVQGLQAVLSSFAPGGTDAPASELSTPLPISPASRLGLKWPNDIWLDGSRKLGGILVETVSLSAHTQVPQVPQVPHVQTPARAALRFVVIGVGLNVAPCPNMAVDTPPAWLQELSPHASAPDVLLHLAPALVAVVQAFARSGFAPLHQQYAAVDVLQNRQVVLQRLGADGACLPDESGTALGVNAQGALQVITPAGLRVIAGDDVRVRPVGGASSL